jgi:transmembrane sensor
LNKEEINKIERYINGFSDETEKSDVESLFLEGEPNQYLHDSVEKDFNRFINETPIQDARINQLLDKVYRRISVNDLEDKRKPLNKFFSIYMKVAAVLLIPIIATGSLLYFNKNTTTDSESVSSSVYAPLGSRISFLLPDGTKGMLNGGSSISYSLPFKENRNLTLKGEGWFEVKHDEKHPFIINALNSTIKVLGTSFNLSAYPEENYVELVLSKGKVEFFNKENKEKVFLYPSERIVLEDGKINKSVIDTTKYNGWTKGKLIFRGDPMGEVARRIMRWYNVDIVLADKEVENYLFRGTFDDDKIEDILSFLAMTFPINYEVIPSVMMPDGSIRKEKIILRSLSDE